jgi:hypothetical protein
MNPQELLIKAAETMSERGKATGAFVIPEGHSNTRWAGEAGSVCAYGAMTLAATGGRHCRYANLVDSYDETGTFIRNEVRLLIDQAASLLARQLRIDGMAGDSDDFHAIITANDNPKTTGEDMILSMKRAAGL